MVLGTDDRFDIVGEAADGQEALELVCAHHPDLLLLDLAMPRVDGLEVLRRLQQKKNPPKVVVLSGFTARTVQDQALALGAAAYVEKGRDLGELADLLASFAPAA